MSENQFEDIIAQLRSLATDAHTAAFGPHGENIVPALRAIRQLVVTQIADGVSIAALTGYFIGAVAALRDSCPTPTQDVYADWVLHALAAAMQRTVEIRLLPLAPPQSA